MSEIKIIIADDVKETRESIKKLLSFEKEIKIIGEAENGQQAVELCKALSPDIVLMDINMPVMNGIEATEIISLEMPNTGVIILSVQGEQEYLRKAMIAGAREYLVKPFSADELVNSIKRVKELIDKRKLKIGEITQQEKKEGKIITVFGTKGGVGRSLIACNLATSLVKETGSKVVLLDLDLQFGDVAIMLNLTPKLTISEIMPQIVSLDSEAFQEFLVTHESGLKVLTAPTKPEYAEVVTKEAVEKILKICKKDFDYIVLDTISSFHDITLTALDLSDIILLIMTLDLPTIKNTKLALVTMKELKYPPEKIKLVLNRADSQATGLKVEEITGLKVEEIEKTLGFKFSYFIPSDGKLVVPAVNRGVPFVLSDPQSEIALRIKNLAADIAGITLKPEERKEEKKKTFPFSKFFKK
jgi:pilus assembly protein CpaE